MQASYARVLRSKIFGRGSAAWLASYQIKRGLRKAKMGLNVWGLIGQTIGLAVFATICYFSGAPLVQLLQNNESLFSVHLAGFKPLATVVISGMFINLIAAYSTLTERNDLDLLLSAPIPPSRIVAARLLTSVWRAFFIYVMFASIFVLRAAIEVSPIYFSYLPVAFGVALSEAAITFWLARLLLTKFGLRKGRNISQILGFTGMVLGVTFYQLGVTTSNSAAIVNDVSNTVAEQIMAWLGGALVGQWLPALAILAIGCSVYIATFLTAGRRFARDVAIISGQSETLKPTTDDAQPFVFNRNLFKIIVFKEWRGIFRDARTFAQIAAPLVGLIPVVFAIVRSWDEDPAIAGYLGAPLVIFISAQMVMSLAWMVASVEEAPDLLQSCPISQFKIQSAKLFAAIIPGLIEVAVFGGLVGLRAPAAVLPILLGGTFACLSAAAVEFYRPRPAKRPKMAERPDRSIVAILFGIALSLCWAVFGILLMLKPIISIIPFLVALGLVAWAILTSPKPQHIK
jgi:ABC-2 type transport system permease protein